MKILQNLKEILNPNPFRQIANESSLSKNKPLCSNEIDAAEITRATDFIQKLLEPTITEMRCYMNLNHYFNVNCFTDSVSISSGNKPNVQCGCDFFEKAVSHNRSEFHFHITYYFKENKLSLSLMDNKSYTTVESAIYDKPQARISKIREDINRMLSTHMRNYFEVSKD